MTAAGSERRHTLTWLPGRFAVCRLAPDALSPAWAAGGPFVSVTRTAEELSVVCGEQHTPPDIRAERDWRCAKVHGPFAFSDIGVLAGLLNPLAAAGVSVFAVSTFDTDYILVRGHDAGQAHNTWISDHHTVLGQPD